MVAPLERLSTSSQTAFEDVLNLRSPTNQSLHDSSALSHLTSTVLHNLQHQHDWTSLSVHVLSPLTGLPLPRPLISGLPPKRVYVHPDEQVEILRAEHDSGLSIEQHPELEWILPTHITEKWSLSRFTALFDALSTVPPREELHQGAPDQSAVGRKWRGEARQKRLLLAALHDDSTVVYYIMHDGIVKPRQN
jgi:tRNA-splicing endonuclease subunit Sen15